MCTSCTVRFFGPTFSVLIYIYIYNFISASYLNHCVAGCVASRPVAG